MELNKRGQGLSTNAIILIILGVFVLAILILGFTLGWDKLAPWISTSDNNVATIATACTIACNTHSQFDFCSVGRTVNDGVNEFEDTCYNLATGAEYTSKNYGINKCPAITCN